MQTVLEFIRLSAISASLAMIGIAAIAAAPEIARPAAPAYVILVETYSGETFIAGVGDDCAAAWERAAIPADWREIRCIVEE